MTIRAGSLQTQLLEQAEFVGRIRNRLVCKFICAPRDLFWQNHGIEKDAPNQIFKITINYIPLILLHFIRK